MLNYLRVIYVTNPVRVITFAVALVIFLAAKLGLVVDEQNVGEALLLILPVLLGGEAARQQVSPAVGEVGPDSDSLLPEGVLPDS